MVSRTPYFRTWAAIRLPLKSSHARVPKTNRANTGKKKNEKKNMVRTKGRKFPSPSTVHLVRKSITNKSGRSFWTRGTPLSMPTKASCTAFSVVRQSSSSLRTKTMIEMKLATANTIHHHDLRRSTYVQNRYPIVFTLVLLM